MYLWHLGKLLLALSPELIAGVMQPVCEHDTLLASVKWKTGILKSWKGVKVVFRPEKMLAGPAAVRFVTLQFK